MQEVGVVGLIQQPRDGIVPVAEPVAELRQISAVRAFVDVRRREAVDPAIRQGGVTEAFAVSPGLAARPHVRGATGHIAPGRVAGIPGCGSVWPDCTTHRAVQAVGTEHQVTAQLTVRTVHQPVRRHVGDRRPCLQAIRWQRRTQDVQQGRAMHQCDVTEPVADLRDIGAREPPTALVANTRLAVEDGLLAHGRAHAQLVECVQGVRPQRQSGAHLLEGRCLLQHLHVPTVLTQADRGCEAGDATADDDCLHAHRVPQSVRATLWLPRAPWEGLDVFTAAGFGCRVNAHQPRTGSRGEPMSIELNHTIVHVKDRWAAHAMSGRCSDCRRRRRTVRSPS